MLYLVPDERILRQAAALEWPTKTAFCGKAMTNRGDDGRQHAMGADQAIAVAGRDGSHGVGRLSCGLVRTADGVPALLRSMAAR